MTIKEFNVEVKKSHNFNTFSCGEVVTVEVEENIEKERKAAWYRCEGNVDLIIAEFKKRECTCQSCAMLKAKGQNLLGDFK